VDGERHELVIMMIAVLCLVLECSTLKCSACYSDVVLVTKLNACQLNVMSEAYFLFCLVSSVSACWKYLSLFA